LPECRLTAPGHGGRKVVPADICGQVVGAEVRLWCFSSLRLDGVQFRRHLGGETGWLALGAPPAKVCPCGAMTIGMKTDRIQTDTADTDTNSFSFSDRILGSNTDTDNIFFVE
jgi:hypothetical protein